MLRLVFVLLLCSVPADAASPIIKAKPLLKLPAVVDGIRGQHVRVKAVTAGSVVQWVALDDGLTVEPASELKDSKNGLVSAIEAGEYRLLAYTTIAEVPTAPATCIVRITGPPPVPQPPSPEVLQLQEQVKTLTATTTLYKKAIEDYKQSVLEKDGIIDRLKVELEQKCPPTPTPPIPVPPQPNPTPVVEAQPTRIAIVADQFKNSKEQDALLGDLPFWLDIAKRTGNLVKKIDKSNPEYKDYREWAEKTGLPAIIIMNHETSKVRYSGPLPSKEEINRLVLLYSGK